MMIDESDVFDCRNLCNSGQPETEVEKYVEESYLRSLEKLSNWNDIHERVKGKDFVTMCQDPWQRECLVPLFIRSNYHRMVEEGKEELPQALAKALKDPSANRVSLICTYYVLPEGKVFKTHLLHILIGHGDTSFTKCFEKMFKTTEENSRFLQYHQKSLHNY